MSGSGDMAIQNYFKTYLHNACTLVGVITYSMKNKEEMNAQLKGSSI